MDFTEMAWLWLNKKRGAWSDSTFVKYATTFQKHILPHWSGISLEQISDESVRHFVNKLTENTELSPTSMRFILSEFSQILKFGNSKTELATLEFLQTCSAKVLEKNAHTPQKRVLSPEECSKFLKTLLAVRSKRPKMYAKNILLALFTGMRIGELCALKWSDFDLTTMRILIHGTKIRLPKNVTENNPSASTSTTAKTELKVNPTKSANSTREVPIPSLLLSWILEEKLKRSPDDFVVECDPRTLQNWFKKFLKMAGLSPTNFHTLRHTFATHAIATGADLKTLSVTLGHASTHTTLDLYVHPSFESKCELQNLVIKRMWNGSPNKNSQKNTSANFLQRNINKKYK